VERAGRGGGERRVSLLDRMRAIRPPELSRYRRFVVDGETVGWIPADLAARLRDHGEVFIVGDEAVGLSPQLRSYAERTTAVDGALRSLRSDGWFRGWRNEAYPVGPAFGRGLFQMERAAVPAFGVRAYGIHVNGCVGEGADLRLWVGRRSRHKPTFPGQLDHLVAGGQPAGLSLAENLLKECAEEASLTPDIVRRARPVGIVSYLMENEEGLRNDVLFNYDLDLPADFTPVNTDGEIEEFFLWPLERVIRELSETDNFKFNVAFVIIDFLIRHGFIGPEDPDYLELVIRLRRRPVDGVR
jgi:8-oxo-dGTP pyrophosphatase MutT (NUDIX family)